MRLIGLLGEEQQEPEVDLSGFLARQNLSSDLDPVTEQPDDQEEVDHSLAHLSTTASRPNQQSKKGKVQSIAWDKDLEEMSREKALAEANWVRGHHESQTYLFNNLNWRFEGIESTIPL